MSAAVATKEITGVARSRRGRRVGTRIAVALIAFQLFLVIFGPIIAPYSPTATDPNAVLQAPSWAHPFGTNNNGADIFSRTIAAARIDLIIGVLGVGIGMAIGTPLGAAAGYSRSFASGLLMRLMDFIQSFPVFILALAIVAVAGPRASNVIIVIALLNIPIFVRLVRGEVQSLRQLSFVDAAKAVGNSDTRIVLRGLLPNAMGSSIAQASVAVGWALLLTGGLSFVGAGIQPPTPEWGLMISEGANNMVTGEWWIALFPGLALGLAVLTFGYAGDLVAARMDVKHSRGTAGDR